MSEIVNRIRSHGHWEVTVGPEPYRADRVPTSRLDDILAGVVVRMRGWPVPFIDHRQRTRTGKGWIGQDVDASSVAHAEAWRFFPSGQFTQLRIVSADIRQGAEATRVPSGATSAIEVWEILFYLTELVELAARLSLTDAGADVMTVDARLHGLEGRQLVAGTPQRELHGDYLAYDATTRQERTLPRDELISRPREIAVDMAAAMMADAFGFNTDAHVLSEYQRELTERS